MADWWTDERIQELKKLWAEGHSCSKIGKKMENTRSAIIGKVHRLGLPGRTQPAQPVKRRPKLAFPRAAQKTTTVSNTESKSGSIVGTQLKVIESDVFKPPVSATRILVSDLTSTTCRWPFGEPGTDNFTYCGAPPCSNKDVYCSEHRKVASQPGKHHRDKQLLRL